MEKMWIAAMPFILFLGIPIYLIAEHGPLVLVIVLILLALFVAAVCLAYKEQTSYKPKEPTEEFRQIDIMNGIDFERYIASMLRCLGYTNIIVTKASGDYGADILANRGQERYAFQCKRYSKNIGVKPIQEVYAAKIHYRCTRAIVVTNMRFSQNARTLAKETEVELWDRDKLSEIITSIVEKNAAKK